MKVCNDNLVALMNQGNSYLEAVQELANLNNINLNKVDEILADEAEDVEGIMAFENQSENAWLGYAEYDTESQLDLYDSVYY